MHGIHEREDAIAGTVLDAAIEVHRALGPAFGESVYENALCHELWLRGVAFERQWETPVHYKGNLVGSGRVDVLVEGLVVVELKVVPALAAVHVAQVLSYLRATGLSLGLLVNFGERHLHTGFRRVILSS